MIALAELGTGVLQHGIEFVGMVLGVLVLLGLLRLIGAGLRLAPLAPWARSISDRLAPLGALAVMAGYVSFIALELLLRERAFFWVLLGLGGLILVMGWAALYDLIAGVIVRATVLCQPGDHLAIGDVEGRVTRMGMRVLVLRSRSGDEAVIPYGRISWSVVRRTQSVRGAYVHAFTLDSPDLEQLPLLRRVVVEAALRSHWCAIVHTPKIEARQDGQLEVTIYAQHVDYAPLVEAAVRKAVAKALPELAGSDKRSRAKG